MNTKCVKSIVNVIAAIAAFIAAVLWWRASIVVVKPTNTETRDGWASAQITVEHEKVGEFDPFLTAIKQSEWNKWAAIAASVAALFQGVSLLLPD